MRRNLRNTCNNGKDKILGFVFFYLWYTITEHVEVSWKVLKLESRNKKTYVIIKIPLDKRTFTRQLA